MRVHKHTCMHAYIHRITVLYRFNVIALFLIYILYIWWSRFNACSNVSLHCPVKLTSSTTSLLGLTVPKANPDSLTLHTMAISAEEVLWYSQMSSIRGVTGSGSCFFKAMYLLFMKVAYSFTLTWFLCCYLQQGWQCDLFVSIVTINYVCYSKFICYTNCPAFKCDYIFIFPLYQYF